MSNSRKRLSRDGMRIARRTQSVLTISMIVFKEIEAVWRLKSILSGCLKI